MHRRTSPNGKRYEPRMLRQRCVWMVIGLAGVISAGCDNLLEVSSPGQVEGGTLDTPESVPVLVIGAIADFECAFSNYVLLAGSVGREIMNTGTLAVYNNYDRRRVTASEESFSRGDCASGTGLYTPLSIARFAADDVYRRLEKYSDAEVPRRVALMATAKAYAGYSLVLFGEGFCHTAIDVGPALSPPEVLGLAEERFTKAIEHAQAANDTSILNMAYVGRARARLNLGKLAEAAADARQVRQGFRKDATYSAANARRENKLFTFINRTRQASIEQEYWDVRWNGVKDPRVRVTVTSRIGTDNLTPQAVPDVYPTEGSAIPLATWEEAQLIIAEAEGGQSAVTIINNLLQRAGLAPTFAATSAAEIRAGIIEQRRRQFFLQGHHLGDMLRYGLPFSTGIHPWKLINYFNDTTCFPLPDVERQNNPNIR